MTQDLFPELPAPAAAAPAPGLWCLHIPGPDDVHAAPSKEEAERAAEGFNAAMRAIVARDDAKSTPAQVAARPPLESVLAVVESWPWSADEHAEALQYWSLADWLPRAPTATVEGA